MIDSEVLLLFVELLNLRLDALDSRLMLLQEL